MMDEPKKKKKKFSPDEFTALRLEVQQLRQAILAMLIWKNVLPQNVSDDMYRKLGSYPKVETDDES